jgi:hypothetical protein
MNPWKSLSIWVSLIHRTIIILSFLAEMLLWLLVFTNYHYTRHCWCTARHFIVLATLVFSGLAVTFFDVLLEEDYWRTRRPSYHGQGHHQYIFHKCVRHIRLVPCWLYYIGRKDQSLWNQWLLQCMWIRLERCLVSPCGEAYDSKYLRFKYTIPDNFLFYNGYRSSF